MATESDDATTRELAEARAEIARLEARLAAESEQAAMFRALLETTPDYCYFKDRDRRFVACSRSFEDLLGRPSADIIGHRDEELFPPEIAVTTAEQDRQVIAGQPLLGQVEGGEIEGSERWVVTTKVPWRDQNGEIIGLLGISKDVLELVRAQRSANRAKHALLDRTRTHYRTLIDTFPYGISETDLDGVLTYVSPAFCKSLGYEPHELIGTPSFDLVANPEVREHLPEYIRNLVGREESVSDIQTPVRRKDGSIIHARFDTNYRRDESGAPIGFLSVMTDISPQVRALDELARTQARLIEQERLSVLGRLTATVSHELRNPLGSIRNSVATLDLALDVDRSELVTRVLRRIELNVERCARIIEELLDYNRGGRSTALAPLDLGPWLEDIAAEFSAPAGIALEVWINGPVPAVPVDAERLRRAVVNVIGNACQASDPGSTIELELRERDQRVELCCRDRGPGIPVADAERVFEPLFTTKTFGIGLGLSVTRDVMLAHGGGVEILAREGGGTEVRLWLPSPG